MDAKLVAGRRQRPDGAGAAPGGEGGGVAADRRHALRPPGPGSTGPAGPGFRPSPAPAAAGSAVRDYRPRADPALPAGGPALSLSAGPTGVLALTRGGETSLSPAARGHPREREIRAHEAVHRAQFAAAGRRPYGDTARLEAEARSGARRLMRGGGFQPQFAAPAEAALAYEYASAGERLDAFRTWLMDNTNYDADAIDWPATVRMLLDSDRIIRTEGTEDTATDMSDRYRYEALVEIFDQELAAIPPDSVMAPTPVAAGRSIPFLTELEDSLFDDYLPTLATEDFDPADVEGVSDAFLEHWLAKLETITFAPDGFDISAYRPKPRDEDFEDERLRVLDAWFEKNVQNLMFGFMLDEYDRALLGPHATVKGLPMILPGGHSRSLTAKHWLETLDIEAYRERLVTHLADTFAKHLGKDAQFRRLMRTDANERSRFAALVQVHRIILLQGRNLASSIDTLREEKVSELDEYDWDIFGDPADAFRQMTEVSKATQEFYRDIGPAFDNDEAVTTVLEKMLRVFTEREGLGPLWAGALRIGGAITALKNQIAEQQKRIREDIAARVEVSYQDIADGIAEMGRFATEYLDKTWIPKLHEVALRQIRKNVEILKDRYDNWDTYAADKSASLSARATVFRDVASGLRAGEYDRVELGGESVEKKDAKRLDDAAAVMEAEAKRLRNPSKSSKMRDKVKEALDGFEEVEQRIPSGDEDPTIYGREVYLQAKDELGLNTFPEYTTYGDIIFGRAVAAENPFLSRLVVGWEMVEKLDNSLKTFTILVGLGLLTVASLLTGAWIAGLAAGASRTAASLVLFAIDAVIAIGPSWHMKNEAEALLALVRLDLDHSVTGVSEEDAERALTMAWVGLALSVLLVGFSAGAMAYFRFFRGGVEGAGLSLNYYKLIREQPELFNSLRSVVRDPARLDRMLGLAGDAKELERLLHRMDKTLDLGRVERLLGHAGDVGKVHHMLDVTSDAKVLETALLRVRTFTGTDDAAFRAVMAGTDDVTLVLNVLDRCETLPAAQALMKQVPDTARLSGLLDLAESATTLRGLIGRLGSLERAEGLLGAAGQGSGPRLLRVLELPGAANLGDDAALALARLDMAAIGTLDKAGAAELQELAVVLQEVRAVGIRVDAAGLKPFADELLKLSEGERLLALEMSAGRPPAAVLKKAREIQTDLKFVSEAVEASEAEIARQVAAGTRDGSRELALRMLRGNFTKTGPYQRVVFESVLNKNARALADMRSQLVAFSPDAIIGVERGGPFVAEAVTYGQPKLAARIIRFVPDKSGNVNREIVAHIEMLIAEKGMRRFTFTDVYFGGGQASGLQKSVIGPLAEAHPGCQFQGLWLRERLGFEELEGATGVGAGPKAVLAPPKVGSAGNVTHEIREVPFALGDDAARIIESTTPETIYIRDSAGRLTAVRPQPGETTRQLVIRLLGERESDVTTAAREYISLETTGGDAGDFERIRAIKAAILAAFGDRVAYQVLRLESPEHIEDELRDADTILEASGGKLPVFLVNVTYFQEEFRLEDFAPLEREFGLRLVGEGTDELT